MEKIITPLSLIVLFIIMVNFSLTMKAKDNQLIGKLIHEKKINSISGNFSGITWEPVTKTLMAVSNYPAEIFQLDTHCNVISNVALPDMDDTESISYFKDGGFLISEERVRRVIPISLSLNNRDYTISGPKFIFDLGGMRKYGIEGGLFLRKIIHIS